VVLAAIAALAYFGVLSPGKFLPERTLFPAPLTNVDKATISAATGEVLVVLQNGVGETVSILDYAKGDTDGDCATADGNGQDDLAGNATITNGQKINVTIRCAAAGALTEGDRFKADITLKYLNTYSGQTHPHTGSIVGKVGP